MMHHTIGPMMLLVALATTDTAQAGDPPRTEVIAPAGPVSPQEVIDTVDAAAVQWARSCKKPDGEGLCITRAAPKASAKRCTAPLLGRVTVHARNAKEAERAQAGFDRALRLAEHASEPTDDATRIAYRDAVVQARLGKADLELEQYLSITMPTQLDFFVEEWKQDSGVRKLEKQYAQQVARKEASIKRFKEFFESKTELGRQLNDGYIAIKEARSEGWTLKVALRTAWVALDMADQMRTAPVPKSLAKPESRDAYCDALASQATAPLRQAREAAQYCVDRAAEAELAGPTVDACRDLLSALPSDPK